jgi:hypothetical protein
MYKMETKELTYKEKVLSYLLVCVYEIMLTFAYVILLNMTVFKLFAYRESENLWDSLLISLLGLVPVIIGAFCIRDLSRKLPILDKLSKRKGYTHPPPLHIGFILWRTVQPIKYRAARAVHDAPSFLTGNPGDWPRWDALKKLKESGKLIENKSKISLILILLLFAMPFIYNGINSNLPNNNLNSGNINANSNVNQNSPANVNNNLNQNVNNQNSNNANTQNGNNVNLNNINQKIENGNTISISNLI